MIYLIGAVQAFFLVILIFNKTGKSDADFVLAAWMALMGLHLLSRYSFTTGIFLRFPDYMSISTGFPLLQGPFMLVYIWVATGKSGKMLPVYWLHALPYLFFTVYFIIDFNILAEDKLAYLQRIRSYELGAANILAVLSHTHGPSYLIWSLFALRKHSTNLHHNFSYREGIDLRWLRNVLLGLGLVWFIVLVAGALEYLSEGRLQSIGDDAIFLAVTAVVFFLGYFGIKQRAIYDQLPKMVPETTSNNNSREGKSESGRYSKSGLKKEDAQRFVKDLLEYMEIEKPWLNSKLSLKDVAAHLNLSNNYTSQIINEQVGKTFFDFINEYRVEEVKRQLKESRHRQVTLLAIAFESGFNSKSSFNSIFKQITKSTPSEFIRKLNLN